MSLLPALLITLSLTAQIPAGAETKLHEAKAENRQPDVAVVCPASFQAALAPWIKYRQAQGHRIAFLNSEQTPQQIRAGLQLLAKQGVLKYVLLVGDADPGMHRNPKVRAVSVPTHYVEAKINVKWGSEPILPTDNWYADFDEDNRPDVAIGRLTADTPEELSIIVQKIIAYEKSAGFGTWRRKVNFVAGVGGFGKLADAVLESSTRTLIAGGLPAAVDSSMTYASWQSPYCPHPRSFHDTTVARLNEGCLFWVYIGHGHYRTLDYMRGPEGAHRILTADDIAQLRCETGNPIAFFMACYTGAFDAGQDCLAEEMLRTPGGPVAIFSGSRVTMPYAMAVMGTELIQQCFTHRAETLGEAIMHAKRAMLVDPKQQATAGSDPSQAERSPAVQQANQTRRTLDTLASIISPAPDELAAERREHVQMFNLFGDPLLRIQHGSLINLEVPSNSKAGDLLQVSGTTPLGGRCLVELVATRGRLTYEPSARAKYGASPTAIAELNADYQRANNRCWASQEQQILPGVFRMELKIPAEASGKGHVCVFIEGTKDFAQGAADLTIGRKASE